MTTILLSYEISKKYGKKFIFLTMMKPVRIRVFLHPIKATWFFFIYESLKFAKIASDVWFRLFWTFAVWGLFFKGQAGIQNTLVRFRQLLMPLCVAVFHSKSLQLYVVCFAIHQTGVYKTWIRACMLQVLHCIIRASKGIRSYNSWKIALQSDK